MKYLFAVLLLAGCATTRYVKDGGTQQDLSRAHTECKLKVIATRRLAGQPTAFIANSADMRECMQGEGWEARRE